VVHTMGAGLGFHARLCRGTVTAYSPSHACLANVAPRLLPGMTTVNPTILAPSIHQGSYRAPTNTSTTCPTTAGGSCYHTTSQRIRRELGMSLFRKKDLSTGTDVHPREAVVMVEPLALHLDTHSNSHLSSALTMQYMSRVYRIQMRKLRSLLADRWLGRVL